MKSAIEDYFPIVDINRLAVPERNAFKPIYTMHKWFARRSSSVFRAILLGALKPAETDIMKEFYKDHTNDPDTKGKVILDPFMGGGTTVVEALRLGCKVVGVDLNPVAWFIVKTEVKSVDLTELQAAFDRLVSRRVKWSGKPLKQTLLSLYKTECPECSNKDADILYTFWVKSAPCTTGNCNYLTPLFSDYIISQKKPSIRYFPNCSCPKCKRTFDWEIDSASLVGVQKLMVNSPGFSAGEGRSNTRWAYSSNNKAECPWCGEIVIPVSKSHKAKRKKVPLSVLYCPACEEVWQYRGELADNVQCPSCSRHYNPIEGNMPEKGKFICRGSCGGNVDAVIAAIRTLSKDHLLPTRPYVIEGYCEKCAGTKVKEKEKDTDFFEEEELEVKDLRENGSSSDALLKKNSGKFFKRISSSDQALYRQTEILWTDNKSQLPYPLSEVPEGEKTKSGLIAHHYFYWRQMFNCRQILALSTLLDAIREEPDLEQREFLLLAFSDSLEANNTFTRTITRRKTPGGTAPGGVFSRHDFQPKMTYGEQNVFGSIAGRKTFSNCFEKVREGKDFNLNIYDRLVKDTNLIDVQSLEKINSTPDDVLLMCQSSADMSNTPLADQVITDPPYAGNVNYSELSDFFYVWLRLLLKDTYPQFLPEFTPKADEAIENKNRGKSSADYKNLLNQIFKEASRVSRADAQLIFTFHHAEDSAWEALLDSICESGYFIEAVYPVHGEAENSMHLMDNEAISYDLVHVCRKRENGTSSSRKAWATIKHDIRRRAREEARLIESGRYGNEPLAPSDINILLIGKCLELYSKNYGTIVDHEDKPVPLRRALEEIKMLVDQLVAKDRPFPTELEDLDVPSYIYFSKLCGYKEISGDELSKSTRGIVAPSILKDYGLIIKGRENRGRSFEIKLPVERMNSLKPKFAEKASNQAQLFDDDTSTILTNDVLFVDCVHFLIGSAELGEQVRPWLQRFGGLSPQIHAALEWLIKYPGVTFKESAKKVLNLMDERTLFTTQG